MDLDELGGGHRNEASVPGSACSRDVKIRTLSTQQQLFLAPSLTLSVHFDKRPRVLLAFYSLLESAIDD